MVSNKLEALSLVGTILGKYELKELIAAPTDGLATYKAEQIGLERTVTIKVLFAEQGQSTTSLERFRREQQATANLNHPNIVTVYDSGVQDGFHYYVTEFLRAQSLEELIVENGPLSQDEILKIGTDILSAFVHTHEKKVLHRNLNSSSIGFDVRENAVISDFATVKVVDHDSLTNSGVLVGKREFMAPEQLLGRDADERSDLYLICSLLYEMTTGRRPFPGIPPGQEEDHVVPEIRNSREDLDADLVTFIEKGLCYQAEDRHRNAKEMLKDLSKISRRIKARLQLSVATPSISSTAVDRSCAVSSAEFDSAPCSAFAPAPPPQNTPDEPFLPKYWLTLPLIIILFILAVLIEHFLLPEPELKLVEQVVNTSTRGFSVQWRVNIPCYTYVVKSENSSGSQFAMANYAVDGTMKCKFGKLEPGKTYDYRFFFSHHPLKPYKGEVAKYQSKVFYVRTLDEVKFLTVDVVPSVREATVTWRTSKKCSTVLRYGPTPDCLLEVDESHDHLTGAQKAHLTGLKRETKYYYFLEASSATDDGERVRSKTECFTTLAHEPEKPDELGPIEGVVSSYIAKVQSMSDDERNSLRRGLENYLLLNPTKALPRKKKVELATTKTTKSAFQDRLSIFSLWLDQLAAVKAQIPYNESTIGRLQALQQINEDKACKKLDLHFEVLYQADRVIFGY